MPPYRDGVQTGVSALQEGAARRGGPLQVQTHRSEDRPLQGKKEAARLGASASLEAKRLAL
jgi:hypothetical protein